MSIKSLIRTGVSLCLIVALVGLTGCAKSEESTKVGADGKGTTVITMSIDTAKLKGIQEMMEGMGMGGGEEGMDDPTDELNEESFREKFEGKEGIKLISVKQSKDEEKGLISLKAEIEFDSLEALYKSGVVDGVDVTLEKLDDGSYRFTRVMGADMGGPDGAADSPEAQQMMEAMMGMFEPFMEGFEMSAEITLPTAIIETSGEIIGASKVRWALGFKDIMKAEKRKQVVTFGGEGLSWKPFTAKASDVQDAEAEAEPEPAAPTTPGN